MKRAGLWIAVLLCTRPIAAADVDPAVLEAEARRIAVIDQAKDSVLALFSSSGAGGGSGVVISPDGYALTNFHVAKPCGVAMQCGMADGRLYPAVVVGYDPTGDVALIKLFGRDDFPCAVIGDSDQVGPGERVFAMGNPFLLATDFQPAVSCGILSGVHRYQYPAGTILEYTDCLQTDASINPGNSGGPLFDAEGRLIGIIGRASFDKRGRVNVGAGYAISINQVKNFMGHLRSGRIVDHATLGATVALDDEGRVVVSDLMETCDAYRRGLRYDDEIVRFGGRPIHTPNGFKNALGIYPKGWRVPLSFRRDGRRYDVLVRLEGVHTQAELLEKASGLRAPGPQRIPQPGDDPEPKQPGPGRRKPGDVPGPKSSKGGAPIPAGRPIPGPGRQPMPSGPAQVPMPPVVREHFDAKRGYANYHFNRLNRDRVYKAWTARGGFGRPEGTWTITGPLEDGARFRLELSDAGASLRLPLIVYDWDAADPLGSSLAPPGSGGLLATMHLWRRLALHGPGRFGEVYYLGTVPLAGHDALVDVLVGIHGGLECRFLFDSGAADLLAIEMFPDEQVDPCEVYFFDYRQRDGRRLPGRMEARVGDQPYATFVLDTFDFEPRDGGPAQE